MALFVNQEAFPTSPCIDDHKLKVPTWNSVVQCPTELTLDNVLYSAKQSFFLSSAGFHALKSVRILESNAENGVLCQFKR